MGTLSKNRCPKCQGNVFLYNDFDGWYEQCLQCGHINYLEVVYENNKQVVRPSAPVADEVPAS